MSYLAAASYVTDVALVLSDTDSRAVDTAPQQIEIGAVRFRAWQIHPVPALPADFPAHDAYVIKVNADLVLAPSGSGPCWLEFGFDFKNNGVVVVDMVPRAVSGPEPASGYAVTRNLAFIPQCGPATPAARPESIIMDNLPLPPVQPTIQAFGIGGSSVWWRHQSPTPAGVPVGSYAGWLILLTPAGLREVTVHAGATYHATRYQETAGAPAGTPSSFTVQLPAGPPARTTTRTTTITQPELAKIRLGFAVDIIGWSDRPAVRQWQAQQRLRQVIRAAVEAAGVTFGHAEVQPTGDGMNVVLPAGVIDVATLPRIMTEVADRLGTDNADHIDRIRVRMAADTGAVSSAPLGFAGPTVVRFCRAVNSDQLREFASRNPAADLVVAISDWIYDNFIRPGYSDLDERAFTREQVVAKGYQAMAWLWASPRTTDP